MTKRPLSGTSRSFCGLRTASPNRPFQALRQRLGDHRLAELTGIVGGYVGLACSLNAFEIAAPEGMLILPTG